MTLSDFIEFVWRQMYKVINDIEGDNIVEEEEDFNEVDEEKDDQSNDNKNDDTNSGDDEEDNNQEEESDNTPTKNTSKPSYTNDIPKNCFSLGLCLLLQTVHLPTRIIDWHALKLVMGLPNLIKVGQQKGK